MPHQGPAGIVRHEDLLVEPLFLPAETPAASEHAQAPFERPDILPGALLRHILHRALPGSSPLIPNCHSFIHSASVY